MFGEMEDGGLIRVRVSGFTIGIGFRDRITDGWCSFGWLFREKVEGGEMYGAVDVDGRENAGVIWCCRGECWGEPLERDDRSDVPDVMDCRWDLLADVEQRKSRMTYFIPR